MLKKYSCTTENFQRVEGFDVQEGSATQATVKISTETKCVDSDYLTKTKEIQNNVELDLSDPCFANLSEGEIISYIRSNTALIKINVSGNNNLDKLLHSILSSTALKSRNNLLIVADFRDVTSLTREEKNLLIEALKADFSNVGKIWTNDENTQLKIETNLSNTVLRKLTASKPEVLKR